MIRENIPSGGDGRLVIPVTDLWSYAADTDDDGVTVFINTTMAGTPDSTTVGTQRNRWDGWWLYVPHIYVTDQNVTLTFKSLYNAAWADAITADVPSTFTGGDNTITAGAAVQEGFGHRIRGEWLLYATNGSTAPTILDYGVPCLTNFNPVPGTY